MDKPLLGTRSSISEVEIDEQDALIRETWVPDLLGAFQDVTLLLSVPPGIHVGVANGVPYLWASATRLNDRAFLLAR